MNATERTDVIVIGGGHAGVEAATAAARMGAATVLLTQQPATIGVMSCNPAIGGLGRGHIVREIDALDGIMGRAIDGGGIQFRMLNRRKGPAVQGPRAQADRELYREAVQALVATQPGLEVVAGEAVELRIGAGRVAGLLDDRGREWRCGAVVLTTGTFLDGRIHRGLESWPAGRQGDPAVGRLAASLRQCGLVTRRLKTGTPPRLLARTIAWDRVDRQEGDAEPEPFSFLNDRIAIRQIACGITHTNPRVHDFIRAHLELTPTFSGAITASGVRYCPSIEDKVVRFAERDRHQVYLEPEGRDSDLVYPNGISTALPPAHQLQMLRMIRGLEAVEIAMPGYAIEYDGLDARVLRPTLEMAATGGLFLAGQINGTTGYEEAAGQGAVAGINAALRAAGGSEFVLDRASGYIGVMIDDITSRGVTEPYRMLTSRAEFRLSLRAGNADRRLTSVGSRIGVVGAVRRQAFAEKMSRMAAIRALLEARSFSAPQLRAAGGDVKEDGTRQALLGWLEHPQVSIELAVTLCPELGKGDQRLLQEIETDCKYAPYLGRQAREIAIYRGEAELRLDPELDYDTVAGLSREAAAALRTARPRTLAAASRLSGMTPAALALLYRFVRAA